MRAHFTTTPLHLKLLSNLRRAILAGEARRAKGLAMKLVHLTTR